LLLIGGAWGQWASGGCWGTRRTDEGRRAIGRAPSFPAPPHLSAAAVTPVAC
jgi:hypothetical protein